MEIILSYVVNKNVSLSLVVEYDLGS